MYRIGRPTIYSFHTLVKRYCKINARHNFRNVIFTILNSNIRMRNLSIQGMVTD